jgi:hypothetical protein
LTAYIKHEQIVESLRATKGTVALAARRLGISRQGLIQRIHKSPELEQLLVEEREIITDTAELKMVAAIMAGEPWAISMRLKTLGKDRGYGDSLELIFKQAETLAKAYNLDPAKIIDLAQKRRDKAS